VTAWGDYVSDGHAEGDEHTPVGPVALIISPRAARCALPWAAEVADRLFRTLTSVIE
jgi:hypothetical protein